MMPRTPRNLATLCALLAACSSGGSARKLNVGHEPDGKDGGSAGFGPGSDLGSDGGIGSGDELLSVHVEDIRKMTIDIITLACAGDCADVEAVAHGGNPPYAIAWEDGSTSTKRHVCLDASKQLSVSATDTAIDSDEFHYDATTVTTEITATVLTCSSDAGAGTDTDATTTDLQCAAVTIASAASCTGGSDGIVNPLEGVSLEAGVPRTIRVTGTGSYTDQGWHYELWGSSDGCALDELLGSFQLHNGPLDVPVCITPKASYAHLILFYRFAATDGVSLSTWMVDACDGC